MVFLVGQGVPSHLVEVFQDEPLAGVGNVQVVDARTAGADGEITHARAGEPQYGEVVGAVKVPEALHGGFAFVRQRRQGRQAGHQTIAYQAHEKGLCSIAHPFSSFSNGARRAGTRLAQAAGRVMGITVSYLFT